MKSPRLSVFSMSLFLLIVSLSGAVTFGQDSSSSGWTPELGMKVKVSARFGFRLTAESCYTVSQAVITSDKSEFVAQIWTANTDGSDPLQLTSLKNRRITRNGRRMADDCISLQAAAARAIYM